MAPLGQLIYQVRFFFFFFFSHSELPQTSAKFYKWLEDFGTRIYHTSRRLWHTFNANIHRFSPEDFTEKLAGNNSVWPLRKTHWEILKTTNGLFNGLVYKDSHFKFPTWFNTSKSELQDSRHHVINYTNSSMVSLSDWFLKTARLYHHYRKLQHWWQC